MSTRSVPGSHITVALSDGTANAKVTVLAVHVVDSGTGLITQPDAKVLDLDGALLCDFLEISMNLELIGNKLFSFCKIKCSQISAI